MDHRTDNAAPSAEQECTVIEPPRGWGLANPMDLWHSRGLLYYLVWRDLKVRYKQTVLGVLWAVIPPVLTVVVFSVFFGRLMGLQDKLSVPYPVFAYAGLLPWRLFATSVGRSGPSVVGSASLITKVYFPRIVIPVSSVGAAVVDYAISLLVLGGVMIAYSVELTPAALLIIPLTALTLMAALGVGTLLSALTVAYRDFRQIIPFLVQIWLFVTPVIYPVKIVPERWRPLLALNPMAGIVNAYRAVLLPEWTLTAHELYISAAMAFVFLFSGMFCFRQMEKHFADII